MSRFDELSNLYALERHEWWQYRGKCAAFARDVQAAIIQHLGFPADCVRFVPSDDGEEKPGSRYTAFGVQTFEDDGYCQFPMELVLYNGNANTFPRYVHRLLLRVQQRSDGRYSVKLYPEADPIEISSPPENLSKVVDGVFELIRESHQGTLQQYLLGSEPRKSRIGFDLGALVDGSDDAK